MVPGAVAEAFRDAGAVPASATMRRRSAALTGPISRAHRANYLQPVSIEKSIPELDNYILSSQHK